MQVYNSELKSKVPPSSLKAIEGHCPPVTLQLLEAATILTADSLNTDGQLLPATGDRFKKLGNFEAAFCHAHPSVCPSVRPRPSPYGLFSVSVLPRGIHRHRDALGGASEHPIAGGRTVVLCVVRRVGDNDRPAARPHRRNASVAAAAATLCVMLPFAAAVHSVPRGDVSAARAALPVVPAAAVVASVVATATAAAAAARPRRHVILTASLADPPLSLVYILSLTPTWHRTGPSSCLPSSPRD